VLFSAVVMLILFNRAEGQPINEFDEQSYGNVNRTDATNQSKTLHSVVWHFSFLFPRDAGFVI
jgi:hypothetical protein